MTVAIADPQRIREELLLSDAYSDAMSRPDVRPYNRPHAEDLHPIAHPQNVTVEYFRSEEELSQAEQVGVVATRHYLKAIARSERYQYVHSSGGPASSMFADADMGIRSYGEGTALGEIAKAIGVEFSMKTDEEADEIAVLAPGRAEVINQKLQNLGITDRTIVEFEDGQFSGLEFFTYLAKGEIPFASDDFHGMHDRVFHLMAYTVLAPEVFSWLRQKAGSLVEAHNQAAAALETKERALLTTEEEATLFKAEDAIRKNMISLDYTIPSMAMNASKTPNNRKYIGLLLKDELGITDSAQREKLLQATEQWIQGLKTRAKALHT